MSIRNWTTALLGAALIVAASNASADPQRRGCAVSIMPGGELVSLTGTATAADACGGSRDASCGNSLFAGETLSTGANSTAGLMVDQVLVVLGPDSAASIGVTDTGAPDVVLTRGSVRLIDPREAGAPARLAAGNASSEFVGNDAEARIVDNDASICGWEGQLEVKRGAKTSLQGCSGGAGSSVALAVGGGTGGAATCEPRPDFAVLTHLIPLPPVAGPPPGFGPPLPEVQSAPPLTPCDNPGGACGGAGAFTVVEQPVGNGPFPGGGGGGFPGGGGQLP